tara:strand:- start:4744 stop:5040 length:297 start_codon:yes stop_codon:yes gene_type:complete
MKELSEESKFQVSLKTMGGLSMLIATLVGMWFGLQAEITEAKMLPAMPISEKEFELKDQLIRATILSNGTQLKNQQEQLNKIENKIDKIDERLYNLNK